VARTHGVHAEIYSFGLKFYILYDDLKREYGLLKECLEYVSSGKISGAVGLLRILVRKLRNISAEK
jgi:adenylosuccinate lyase